jgi:hypothetical protein
MKKISDNIAHVCNLILMAIQDQNFDIEEKRIIIKIATRLGIGPSELDKAIKNGNIQLQIPDSIDKRIEQLNDLVTVMVVDSVVDKEELKYISRFLKLYGFEETNISDKNIIDSEFILNHNSYNDFINKFKKITGDELSQIVVDKEFNIRFPLYNSKLAYLGPLPKTLYIFFLIKETPVNIADLSNEENVELLKAIYSKVSGTEYYVDEKIMSLIDMGEGFNRNRSLVKRSLKNALPETNQSLICHYEISGQRGQPKKVNLEKDLIQIIPAILR